MIAWQGKWRKNLALAYHVQAGAHADFSLLVQVVLALWEMIRTYNPAESALRVRMCESEKASKRASEYVRPRYASPRAMNSDLASLELVHPETRHFRYRLLGKAVILPGLCGSKNKQATCLAETKTRSNVPCVPVTGLEPQKTL